MKNVLTRGKAVAWAHRIRSVLDHQVARIGAHIPNHEISGDLSILEAVLTELAELDVMSDPPALPDGRSVLPDCRSRTPEEWRKGITAFVRGQRKLLAGYPDHVMLYNAAIELHKLDEIAKAIEQTARTLATTGEWAMPIDPAADTKPGLPVPVLLPRDDDADHS